MQIVINIDDDVYKRALVYKNVQLASNSANDLSELITAVANGTPLPKGLDVDTLLQKATDEVFVQCKQFNERFSKDWNEGFNDGMFHALTIIKEIVKADKEVENADSN